MNLEIAEEVQPQDEILLEGTIFSRTALLQQLDRLIVSRHFRNSKRYPALLRFVVEQTLTGHGDELKERTLGVCVFDREHDYDTNVDPIVRVTAGEIRKRIAQYYQDPLHDSEIRIDLPLGSYVPHFAVSGLAASAVTAAVPPDPVLERLPPPPAPLSLSEPLLAESSALAIPSALPPRRRRWSLPITLSVISLLLAGAVALVVLRTLPPGEPVSAIEATWHPVLSSRAPALVVLGVHTLDSNGHDIPPNINASFTRDQQQQETMLSAMISRDMVPISDIVSYSQFTDLLTRHGHPYTTRPSTEATVDELRHGPVLLIGGLDNVWTMRCAAKLRYRFFARTIVDSGIIDSQHPATAWTFDNSQRALGNSRDYALVASYFDPEIEQRVVIAAGIGKTGTQAAAEFLTSNRYLQSWLADSHLQRDRNVELVLSTDILDGRPGPPHILASYAW